MKSNNSHKNILVSIVSPVHNEEVLIASFVQSAVRFLRKNKIVGEVVVIENGSTDKTLDILTKLQKKFPELTLFSLPKGNKGVALKFGFEKAKGQYLVQLDTDLWDEKFVKNALKNLKKYDIVIGSKVIKGAKDDRPLSARLMNSFYNFGMKLFFDLQGTETHAKLSFRKEAILPLVKKCQTGDLVFDTELVLRAERAGLSKLEIPTQVKEIRPRRFSVFDQAIKSAKNALLLLRVLGPKFNVPYLLVFSAVILGAFLRFYNYHQWFFFSVDEEHYSFMTRMITVDHHFPLIGGPISATKLYMAPWFLYFNAIFFLMSKNNPVFSGMVFAGMELTVVLLVYLIGKKIFSPMAGALAAILYGGSMLVALFARHYWNITLTPLYSAITFYALLRYFEGSKKWLIVAALVVGFGMSATFSVFAIFLFALAAIILYKRNLKDTLLFLGIIAAMNVPLIIFDLRHNFWLFRGLLEFLTQHSYDRVPLLQRIGETAMVFVQTLGKSLAMTGPVDVSNETSICFDSNIHQTASIWTSVATVFFLANFVGATIRAKIKKYYLLVILLAFVNFGSLFLFRADPAERHFLPFLPLFFVTVGVVLARLIKKFGQVAKALTFVLIVALLAINVYSFVSSSASYGIAAKEAAVAQIISKTTSGAYYFEATGTCHKWGYRYLFSEFNHEPAASYLDDSFSWMYSRPPQPQNALTKVTVSAPDNGHLEIYYLLIK